MTSQINEWYRGRKVFVTGASGLMGKVLIEKLLYSVPDVGCVYALVRSKRGKSPESRIEDMWKLPVSTYTSYTNNCIDCNSINAKLQQWSVNFKTFVGKFQLFSRIREEKPHVMKKLVPVIGDICYDDLGIDEKVLEKLREEVRKTRLNKHFLH